MVIVKRIKLLNTGCGGLWSRGAPERSRPDANPRRDEGEARTNIQSNPSNQKITHGQPPQGAVGDVGVSSWEELYRRFLQSLKVIIEKGVVLEFRIPVAKLPIEWYAKVFEDIMSVLGQQSKVYVVLIKVLGRPVVEPRDKKWYEKYCLSDEEFETYVHNLKTLVKENRLIVCPCPEG